MLHKLFALRLRELPRKRNTLELQGNQKSSVRRFCVSQSLKLPQHVAETLDGFDHQLRGFLALLTPCLLVKRGKLTVSEVANVMHSVGRSDLLGNDESEAKAEIARALSARRHFAKPFAGFRLLADYLFALRELEYLDVFTPDLPNPTADEVAICAGPRWFLEFDASALLQMLNERGGIDVADLAELIADADTRAQETPRDAADDTLVVAEQ
eukprot:GHVT01014344.1.p1 GENE.GHVT01014344.1~~GHVT01014344.1.p1  ORF type:complete len:212 (+),score=46.85 GHVT01014344.1:1585-2220(+)